MARNFVTNDIISFPVPAALIGVDGGPLTIVAVIKVNTSAYQAPIYTRTSASAHAWWCEVDTTGGLHGNYGTGTTARPVGTVSTGAYFVAIFRKDASGSFQPVGRYLTGAGFTTDSGNITAVSTLIDGPALDSGGVVQFGRWGTTDYSDDLDVAAVAVWNSYLDDSVVPGLTSWTDILAESPTYWGKFDGTNIEDSAGGSPTTTGTTSVADPSGFFGAADQNVTASGIVSGQAVGSPTISATYTINVNGIASSERAGTAAISATYTINANGITSGERSGDTTVTLGAVTISAAGVFTAEQLGSPTIQSLTQINANGIVSSERAGTPTLSATYTINANGIASSESLGPTAVNLNVAASGVPSAEGVGSPSIHRSVSTAGIASNEQVGAATVTPGAVTINAHGIVSSEAVGSALIILAQSISAAGIATLEAMGTPTITVGPVTINASGIVSSESFGSAQLGVSVTPAGIPSNEGVGSPTITVTAAGISAGNIASSEQVGSPTISTTVTITTHGIRSEEQFGYSPLYNEILFGGIGSAEKFGSSTITVGPTTINASGIFSTELVGSPIINAIPLIPPTPQTLLRLRIGQTVLTNDTGQSTLRFEASETLISI